MLLSFISNQNYRKWQSSNSKKDVIKKLDLKCRKYCFPCKKGQVSRPSPKWWFIQAHCWCGIKGRGKVCPFSWAKDWPEYINGSFHSSNILRTPAVLSTSYSPNFSQSALQSEIKVPTNPSSKLPQPEWLPFGFWRKTDMTIIDKHFNCPQYLT